MVLCKVNRTPIKEVDVYKRLVRCKIWNGVTIFGGGGCKMIVLFINTPSQNELSNLKCVDNGTIGHSKLFHSGKKAWEEGTFF